jgi:hypothetical protein
MAGAATNILIAPVNVLWRIEASEIVDFAGLTGADVKGASFNISTAKDAILHYVWGDDSVEADPAPAGRTAVPFTVVGDTDTAATLATACAAALDALPGYSATASDTTVTISRADVGEVTATADTDMGVAITQCRLGKDYDLGLLEGDVEFNYAPSNFIVQAHQTGVTPRAALYQGSETLEVSTTMLETQKSQLDDIYNVYGDTFTPAAGSEVTGIGTSKQGENLLVKAARLVLKPVNAVDDSQNTSLMLAIPVPETLTFSGENPRTLAVTWQGFIDDQIDSRASAFVLGDESQSGLKV